MASRGSAERLGGPIEIPPGLMGFPRRLIRRAAFFFVHSKVYVAQTLGYFNGMVRQ